MTPATYRASDFLAAAAAAGVEIVVGTSHPQSLAGDVPERHLTLPFHDPPLAAAQTRAFAAAHPLTAIMGVDDEGAVVAAAIAAELELPHAALSAVAATCDKAEMRRLLQGAAVGSPPFTVCRDRRDLQRVAREIGFPCVVKPLFLAASRGVIRADDPAALEAALARVEALLARPDVQERARIVPPVRHEGMILVEEFVPGDEVALEGLLEDGVLRVLALFDKPGRLEGPYFEETLYVIPSRLPASTQRQIEDCAAKTVEALGLNDGPVHGEFRVNRAGVWVIELAARTMGGLCARVLRFGAGMSLEEIVLRHACGLEIPTFQREAAAAGVMMIPIPRRGVLRTVHGEAEARKVEGVEDVILSIAVGQEVVPLPEGNRYLGFLFARGPDPAAVEATLRSAHGKLAFSIQAAPPPGGPT